MSPGHEEPVRTAFTAQARTMEDPGLNAAFTLGLERLVGLAAPQPDDLAIDVAGGRPGPGRRSCAAPQGDPEVAAVWSVVHELVETGDLSDESFAAAVQRWGEQLTVELVAAAGYYTMLAWVLNAARVVPDEEV